MEVAANNFFCIVCDLCEVYLRVDFEVWALPSKLVETDGQDTSLQTQIFGEVLHMSPKSSRKAQL